MAKLELEKARQSITVHVPQTSYVSYSLFARGFNMEAPQLSEDGTEYSFKFLGGTVAVLFYSFAGFKKAYAVTGWQDERDGDSVNLPGVDGKLCILFSARGGRCLVLDRIVEYLTKCDGDEPFRFPLSFWYKLGAMLESHRAGRVYVDNLLQLYRDDGKNFFCSWREKAFTEMENEILQFCCVPKSRSEVAVHFGYKNERAFAVRFLDELVRQGLLKYENGKYFA